MNACVKLINKDTEVLVYASKLLRDRAWSYLHTILVESGNCDLVRKSPTAFVIHPHDGVSITDCAYVAIFALTVARSDSLEIFWRDYSLEKYLRDMRIFIDYDPKLIPTGDHHIFQIEWNLAMLIDKNVTNILDQIKSYKIAIEEFNKTLNQIISSRQKLLFHPNSTGLVGRIWCWINIVKIDLIIADINQQKGLIDLHNRHVDSEHRNLYFYHLGSGIRHPILSKYHVYMELKRLSEKTIGELGSVAYPTVWQEKKTQSLHRVELLTPI